MENWDLYTTGGAQILDFVGRYESLDTDFETVLRRIGLEGKVSLPKANVSKDRGSYRDYYDATSRELIAAWYGPEIGHFSYVF